MNPDDTLLFWQKNLSVLVATHNMLSVSADGYIRLSFAEIQTIALSHLISGLDESVPVAIRGGVMATDITGYTEWVSTTTPTITIGWDWQMDADHRCILLRRISEPRSNVMLQNQAGIDIGPEKTITMLEPLIDGLDWIDAVRSYIDHRYG